MLTKFINNQNMLEKDKKLFRNIMIIALLISSAFSLNIFIKTNTDLHYLESTILFIRYFNSILSLLAFGTCIISYKRIRRDDVFVLSLMYLGLSVGIIFGQIDYLTFYNEQYSLSSYLTVSTSVLRIFILITALSPNNVLKSYIVKNKKISIIFVALYTILAGTLERNLNFGGMDYSTDFFVVYNGILAMIYLSVALVLFTIGKEEKEYFYIVISSSVSTLAVKALYAIMTVESISFDVKLISVSITYIIFIIVIVGAFIELYIYINKTKYLNQKLSVFYNFADDNKHSFMLICREDGKTIYANKKVKEYYCVDNDEDYLEKLDLILLRKSNEIDRTHEMLTALDNKGFWRGIIKNNSDNIYIDCSAQLISKDGEDKEIAITYMDITEVMSKELELEKLKVYNKERTEFMSNISHELRTPVNIFYSTLQLLDRFSMNKEVDLKEMYTRYSKTLHINCKRMLRLINNVVDMSKIESGILRGQFNNYNIVALIEDVTMSVVNYAGLKKIDIVFDTNSEESIVRCDPGMIERVMLNLLSNAIKFSPEKTNIYVNVLVNDDYAEIDIRDEGIGLSKKDKNVIFERFMQADKSLTRENEGSGIGLSIVKSIVELHDGYISVESELGVGSTFKILLPNRSYDCKEYKIYDIHNYTTELELSDIYEISI